MHGKYTNFDDLRCYHPDRSHEFMTLKNCVILDLSNKEIINAIANHDDDLFCLLNKYLFEEKELYETYEYFESFDYYILQGHSISRVLDCLEEQGREEMKKHAEYVAVPAYSDRGRMLAQFKDKAQECLSALERFDKRKTIIPNKRRASFSRNRNQLMLSVIDRDGYICQHCKINKNLTVDHIFPLSKGGTDDLDNLQLLCRPCNSRKCDN